ncbi:ROK family protein [Thermovenabulum sp.]|uniref:ROK family protein n=1 Tax=Thermovenabulum sp. TaxID=3100335 RepID=UPI003C79D13D
MKNFSLGIDLGGTKIATCIIDNNGNIFAKVEVPTLAKEGPEKVISRMKKSVYDVLSQINLSLNEIAGIGIGVPGPIDVEKGIIQNPPNLPGWKDISLCSIMAREFNTKIIVENDANSAALGEFLFGAGKGVKNFIYITISTGIGAGIFIDGKLFKGIGGNAGEAGHMTINFEGPICECGNSGCWEAYASGTALARFAKEGILSGIKTKIIEKARNEEINAEHVFSAAREGDNFALTLVENEGYYLGVGLANLINIFNPGLIAIGGGLTQCWDMFYSKMMRTVEERSLPTNLKHLEIVKAKLDKDAGAIGSASLVFV